MIVLGCSMRAAWVLQRGELEADVRIVRTCSTRGCMRHLALARRARGTRAALTADDVRSIRREHAAGAATYADLAERYQLSVDAVRFIATRRRWKHVA